MKTRTRNASAILASLVPLVLTLWTAAAVSALAQPATTEVGAWGDNSSGQASVPAGVTDVVSVAGGGYHTLALKGDGAVVAWGGNEYGQASVPLDLTGVVGIAAGQYHSLALKADGTVVAWGWNDGSQCNVPANLQDVVQVAAGLDYSLALKIDGTVVSWGARGHPPAMLSGVVAISANWANSLALKADGSVVAWGGYPVPSEAASGAVAVAAGFGHSLVLKADGTVVAWGDGYWGQLNVPAGLGNVVAIAAGQYHSLALKADGTVVTWGTSYFGPAAVGGQAELPYGLSGVVAIGAGGYHSLAVVGPAQAPRVLGISPTHRELPVGVGLEIWAGAVGSQPLSYQWYRGTDAIAGATGPVLKLEHVRMADAGNYHVVVANEFGTVTSAEAHVEVIPSGVVAWGTDVQGQTQVPGGLVDVVRIAGGGYHTLALKGDGAVVAWGGNEYGQASVPLDLTGVVGIAAGQYHSLALKADGTVVAWGWNDGSQCNVPANLQDVVQVAAGLDYSLALKIDGTVVSWGARGHPPAMLSGVVAISANWANSLALKADGSVVAWGGYPVPSEASSGVVAIAAGVSHSLAVKTDGTVVAWGYGYWGQLNVPAGLGNVVAIAAGQYHSLALKADGTVVTWGSSYFGPAAVWGQAELPYGLSGVVAIGAGGYHSLAVVKAGPPILVLLGDNPMTIECGGLFTDPGARATDVNGVDLTARIVVSGNVDAHRPGTYALTYSITTDDGRSAVATRTINVDDTTSPAVGPITAPVDPVQVNAPIAASANFTDNSWGAHAAAWDWGDGTWSLGTVVEQDGSGMVSGGHTYTAAGVYTVTLEVMDTSQNVGTAVYQYVVIYNPDGGFVTGGGWITSPPGAYRPNPLLTGKATFGFNSKYKKGATVPTGQTQFDFHAGGLNFHSESYEWLVISGAKARYKGSGTISGSGDYGFVLIAIDGQVDGGGGIDKFRIKIWDKSDHDVVYDNQMDAPEDADPTTALGGGSIVIHKEK